MTADTTSSSIVLRAAAGDELGPAALYEILRLRSAVFVVEQDCVYLDLDRRDLDAATRHCWIEAGGEVVACLRLLTEPTGETTIGRVVTDPEHRGRGYGARLMRYALAETRGAIVLNAQSRLEDWYASFGFAVAGPRFVEDGIEHTPMRLVEPRQAGT